MDDNLAKWLSGELSDEELGKSLDAKDIAKYKQIAEEVERWVPNNDEEIFSPEDITGRKKEAEVKPIQGWMSISIAAAAVLAIGAFFWIFMTSNPEITTYSTGVGETKEVGLPDGSKATLGPSSEISWDEAFASIKKRKGKKRKVKQKGKAFFQVKSGDPFEVENGVGKVEVLGTSFTVDEFGSGMNVVCYEGKVKASDQQGQFMILNGGEGSLYYADNWENKITITDSRPGWQTKTTKFENAPLMQVVKNLEKLYDIEIVLGSINLGRRFTGVLPNDKLDVALKLVFDPLDISYERKDDKIYLTE